MDVIVALGIAAWGVIKLILAMVITGFIAYGLIFAVFIAVFLTTYYGSALVVKIWEKLNG